jgi:uncharacterized membrane protein (DUF485 family)
MRHGIDLDKSDADQKDAGTPGKIAWGATVLTLASYLALMLGVAYAPGLLAGPIADGGLMSVGLVAGIGVIVVLVIISALFTRWRNQGT